MKPYDSLYVRLRFINVTCDKVIVKVKQADANLIKCDIQLVTEGYCFLIREAEHSQGFFLELEKKYIFKIYKNNHHNRAIKPSRHQLISSMMTNSNQKGFLSC